jgi:hypothetical protein
VVALVFHAPPIGLVVMLIAPAIELLPNSVLCGPFSTSMRPTSARSLKAPACMPSGTSSTITATSASTPMPSEKVPMPRILMLKLPGWVP